ncbi:hypothetical protein KBD81_06200 [Candidatus Woesebacteria bacterium]|nr:hypothetical protein [Candidatus Woesebacteria bacterium]
MLEYFAPNEVKTDAFVAFSLLFQPWKWRKGREVHNLKRRLKSRFFSSDTTLSVYYSSRGALYQYMKALRLPHGTHVLISPIAPMYHILCMKELELIPTYVDTYSDLTMSFTDLQKKYDSTASLILLDHPFGITPKKRREIIGFAKKMKVPLLETLDSGGDLELYRNVAFQSAVLLSFGFDSMFSSVSGAVLAVRGKKQSELVKTIEKNIPNPSHIDLLRMIIFKMATVAIKTFNKVKLGRLLHITLSSFGLFPAMHSKKEHRGSFDSTYVKTFPNIAASLLFPQLDRFNDVLQTRASTIREMKSHDPYALPVPETSLPFYPVCVTKNHPTSARTSFKKLKIKKPKNAALQHPETISLYVKGTCPQTEKVYSDLYLLPTNITQKQQLMFHHLLNGMSG